MIWMSKINRGKDHFVSWHGKFGRNITLYQRADYLYIDDVGRRIEGNSAILPQLCVNSVDQSDA